MDPRVVIVGATGAVGEATRQILEEFRFPMSSLRLCASERSFGKKVTFGKQTITIEGATRELFSESDIVFFAAGGGVSKTLAPVAAEEGALVIDKSSTWRMDPSVPLVIPEINPTDIGSHQGIISSPNCSTIVMLMAIAPLHRSNPIKRIIVDTYQSASGAGGKGILELDEQIRAVLAGKIPEHSTFPHSLAFNVLPHVENFSENDYTTEEMKMRDETRKILHEPSLAISATCVRVPVPISHSEAVHVEFSSPMTPKDARSLLAQAPGVIVVDDPANGKYPLAMDSAGRDEVFVGRIREDLAFDNGLSLWTVGDNLRKGAATNAVQIAQEALSQGALR